ncbi:MAG TPA: hypothetical protein VMI31_19000 [Fimbriimonadaceae bacterium]|nr:hypothetical protein [Fimbriimonadaceae bacterium]
MRAAFFLSIVALALAGCHSQQPASGPVSSASTPQTKVEISHKVTESILGLPFYPGSKEKGSQSSVMETDADTTIIYDATVAAPMQKVADFYMSKLAGGHLGSKFPTSMLVEGALKNGSSVTIEVAKYSPTETEFEITVHRNKKPAAAPSGPS